ncbi:hypothetical protein BC629DRAFT_1602520 [Irpex lacteus]|nr:hypothetical protein BC629DRAFT_1602520 [Irpex lacteus]
MYWQRKRWDPHDSVRRRQKKKKLRRSKHSAHQARMAVRDSPGSPIPRVTSRVSLVTSRVGLADCDASALLNFYHNEEVHLLQLVSILLRQTKELNQLFGEQTCASVVCIHRRSTGALGRYSASNSNVQYELLARQSLPSVISTFNLYRRVTQELNFGEARAFTVFKLLRHNRWLELTPKHSLTFCPGSTVDRFGKQPEIYVGNILSSRAPHNILRYSTPSRFYSRNDPDLSDLSFTVAAQDALFKPQPPRYELPSSFWKPVKLVFSPAIHEDAAESLLSGGMTKSTVLTLELSVLRPELQHCIPSLEAHMHIPARPSIPRRLITESRLDASSRLRNLMALVQTFIRAEHFFPIEANSSFMVTSGYRAASGFGLVVPCELSHWLQVSWTNRIAEATFKGGYTLRRLGLSQGAISIETGHLSQPFHSSQSSIRPQFLGWGHLQGRSIGSESFLSRRNKIYDITTYLILSIPSNQVSGHNPLYCKAEAFERSAFLLSTAALSNATGRRENKKPSYRELLSRTAETRRAVLVRTAGYACFLGVSTCDHRPAQLDVFSTPAEASERKFPITPLSGLPQKDVVEAYKGSQTSTFSQCQRMNIFFEEKGRCRWRMKLGVEGCKQITRGERNPGELTRMLAETLMQEATVECSRIKRSLNSRLNNAEQGSRAPSLKLHENVQFGLQSPDEDAVNGFFVPLHAVYHGTSISKVGGHAALGCCVCRRRAALFYQNNGAGAFIRTDRIIIVIYHSYALGTVTTGGSRRREVTTSTVRESYLARVHGSQDAIRGLNVRLEGATLLTVMGNFQSYICSQFIRNISRTKGKSRAQAAPPGTYESRPKVYSLSICLNCILTVTLSFRTSDPPWTPVKSSLNKNNMDNDVGILFPSVGAIDELPQNYSLTINAQIGLMNGNPPEWVSHSTEPNTSRLRLQILTDKDRWGAGTGLIANALPSNQHPRSTAAVAYLVVHCASRYTFAMEAPSISPQYAEVRAFSDYTTNEWNHRHVTDLILCSDGIGVRGKFNSLSVLGVTGTSQGELGFSLSSRNLTDE